MIAYYNEIDPYAAQWLRNLIGGGHIAPGDVDERSIVDVRPDDLKGYGQCHFFAGIGGWSLALRLAGWTDDRPVWTGSCPCQPLSSAGQRKGHADERHLWPAFHDLISECGPTTVFGEQVASADGREWFAAVRADLEALGHACGTADLCAAGVGAPQIRQRLYWVADASGEGLAQRQRIAGVPGGQVGANTRETVERNCVRSSVGMADAGCERRDGEQILLQRWGSQQAGAEIAWNGGVGGMADAKRIGRERRRAGEARSAGLQEALSTACGLRDASRAGPTDGFWRDADWLGCRDGKWRPVEPGTFPLAHGVSGRVGRLRAYGNAIVPQVAAKFIAAFMECRP